MTPHRLDLATSGIVIFCRNTKSLKELQRQFRNRVVKKKYSAILYGCVNEKSGIIDLPIGRDDVFGPPCFTIDKTCFGKEALTRFELVESSKYCSKVNLYPLTGRTHQLRLHTAAIGHPILGDFFYSTSSVYKSSERLMLHAEEIEFSHPVTKKHMHIVSSSSFELARVDNYFKDLDLENSFPSYSK